MKDFDNSVRNMIKGYSDKEVAELTGLHKETIKRFRLGIVKPNYRTLRKVYKAMNKYLVTLTLKNDIVITKRLSETSVNMIKASINASKNYKKILYQIELGDEIINVEDIINFEYKEIENGI